jgi:hypothetical protein
VQDFEGRWHSLGWAQSNTFDWRNNFSLLTLGTATPSWAQMQKIWSIEEMVMDLLSWSVGLETLERVAIPCIVSVETGSDCWPCIIAFQSNRDIIVAYRCRYDTKEDAGNMQSWKLERNGSMWWNLGLHGRRYVSLEDA